ncbi:hypothetical protein QTG54_000800 [Skeletonema marinoi]|uniref:Uncharacterized protein n=1 Tax=Skeletonema marinoi TaxID=267567 RepID=A0AAD8YPL5_9STRA|nr:hypothetical protein QTG54_000800 [Skeletonema marinoi]
MGRMKRNLSFGGSSNKNNVTSTGSVSSSKSSGRFGRKKKQSYRSGGDWESVQSAGSRTRSMSRSKRMLRNINTNNNSAASVTTMDEMDSNESMTLKGISMGRRRNPSAPIRRPMQEEEGESRVVDEPVEMSLAELRSMSESELEQSMLKAGVPSADISSTKDAVMQLGIDSGTAEEKRRGSLVAFARSFTETNATTSPIHNSSASMDASDATLLESKSISRKSKLEKITELQGEKSTLKKENKALKKTMKKKALKMKIEANAKEKRESETVEDSAKGSLHSVDHDISVGTDTDSKATRRKESSASQRSRDVSVKDVSNLKKMMKKQRQEHESTEFRLKAEIEILTKEVDGLQRELSLALESADDAEKRVDESHEAASKLKRKMRTMSSKLNGLTEEANARDKLIETFTKLLVDKNGGENGVAAVEGKLELAQLIHTGS